MDNNGNTSNEWTGRTARQITLIVTGAFVICFVLFMSTMSTYYLIANFKSEFPLLAGMILYFGILLALISITHSLYGLFIASDNIFCASGEAEPKAKLLHKDYFLQTQTILSILIICIIAVLMIIKLVEVTPGLIITTGAATFALGQNYNYHKKNY